MEALLANLLSPGLASVVYAAAAFALGLWAKRHPTPKLSDVVPDAHAPVIDGLAKNPELLGVARLLLDRLAARRAAESHDALLALATPAAAPGAFAAK